MAAREIAPLPVLQTLKMKVYKDFEELPLEAAKSLRESLLMVVLKYWKVGPGKGSPARSPPSDPTPLLHMQGAPQVRTQLCLALGATATFLGPEHWDGTSVVQWFATRMNQAPVDVAIPCMLELLAILPQETGSHRIAVRPERRKQAREELKGAFADAMTVLGECAAHPAERVKEQVLEAFGSWIRLTEGKGLQGPTLVSHPLTLLALEGLGDITTFDAARTACVELIWSTVREWRIAPEMMPLAMLLAQRVMALLPR